MSGALRIDISSGDTLRIGLIVRGKTSPEHHPGRREQHADCILTNGAPIGFFGEGNEQSGNSIGLRMQGAVYDYARMQIERPFYVDMASAVTNRVVSTVLLIAVTSTAAKAFEAAWSSMTREPGDFNIVGGNCATHASAAFIHSQVVESQIPWLDTPDNLYGQLVDKVAAGKRSSITGFIGFAPKPGGGYVMEVTPYVDAPGTNRPKQHSSSS